MKTNTAKLAPITIATILTIAFLTVFAFLFTGSVHAQDEDSHSDTSEAEESMEKMEKDDEDKMEDAKSAQFSYVAKECDAMTYMARKSLQLFDQANDDISLTNEGIIYAETNIIQTMGPRLLEIGESVKIDSALVEQYARNSQNLTDAEIAAWSTYTANVDFDLADVSTVGDSEEATKTEQQRTEEADSEQKATDEQAAAAEADEADDKNDDDSQSASPFWWVAGAGAVGGLWYLLYRRNEN